MVENKPIKKQNSKKYVIIGACVASLLGITYYFNTHQTKQPKINNISRLQAIGQDMSWASGDSMGGGYGSMNPMMDGDDSGFGDYGDMGAYG